MDTTSNRVYEQIEAGFAPRGLAVTNDQDDDDDDETFYVTQFFALPATGKADGQDDAKSGAVTAVSVRAERTLQEHCQHDPAGGFGI